MNSSTLAFICTIGLIPLACAKKENWAPPGYKRLQLGIPFSSARALVPNCIMFPDRFRLKGSGPSCYFDAPKAPGEIWKRISLGEEPEGDELEWFAFTTIPNCGEKCIALKKSLERTLGPPSSTSRHIKTKKVFNVCWKKSGHSIFINRDSDLGNWGAFVVEVHNGVATYCRK